jgi:hypothetical protein
MARRVSFSGAHLPIEEIVNHHRDLGASLALYFSAGSPSFQARFWGYPPARVREELVLRLYEADLTSSLTVLASVEAAFRIDYLQRCYRREKDPVSRALRAVYKIKGQNASLEDEIFEAWLNNSSGSSSIVSELRSAFRFRHWLAHGRYWTPRLGRRYGFDDIFSLAELTLRSFPFFDFGG